jgi:hypothetical protein
MKRLLSIISSRIRRIFSGSLLLAVLHAAAQNAPVTTAATVSNAIANQDVTVPVTVTGFNTIGSLTLSLDYDYSKLHFVSGTQNPSLNGTFNVGDNDLGNGMHRVIAGWYGSGTSLPNGSAVVTYTFTYLSGNPTLVWYDMGPSCEYTDVNSNILNDIPTSSYYINGLICAALPYPGMISGTNSVCQGQSSVSYSVVPMQNVTGYYWTVPPGGAIVAGANTNSVLVDFPVSASSGNITVNGLNECGNGPVSSMQVSVHPIPAANAGNDTTINFGTSAFLHAASGGAGSFDYHWSPENLLLNPNVQNPQTVPLTATTVFYLDVTAQGSICTSSDNVAVTISGGPLSINPEVIPDTICRGTYAQLFANAGGGTGNYTYSWTSVPPGSPVWTSGLANPLVNPDTTTTYYLTVSDGFSTSSGSVRLVVNLLPTATMSGGDSLCNDGSDAPIRIDLTGLPPWSFIYSNGLNTTTIQNQLFTPYQAWTSEPGVYTVLSVNDRNCEGLTYGSATVLVFPVPSPPEITFTGVYLTSNLPEGNHWYQDYSLIPGATGQTYTPTQNGIYYDIAILNGCSSDSSNNINVILTDAKTVVEGEFRAWPNPATDHVIIEYYGPPSEVININFFSSYGRFLKKYVIAGGPFFRKFRIDLDDMACGVYFLRIENGTRSRVIKLIVL